MKINTGLMQTRSHGRHVGGREEHFPQFLAIHKFWISGCYTSGANMNITKGTEHLTASVRSLRRRRRTMK